MKTRTVVLVLSICLLYFAHIALGLMSCGDYRLRTLPEVRIMLGVAK